MAIKQEITSVSGATAEYHRISEVFIDYTKRKANITVLSYLEAEKRNEEKEQALTEHQREQIDEELNGLLAKYKSPELDSPEEEARRIELSNQLNALPQLTPDDVAPRNIFMSTYTIDLPQGIDFTLEFAYCWLKEKVYTNAEDC